MTGEKIRELRKKHRYSQKQLAEKIGVAQTAISAWETGARGITLEVLMSIATALDEPVSTLIPDHLGEKAREKLIDVDVDRLTFSKAYDLGILDLDFQTEKEMPNELWQAQIECDRIMNEHLLHISDKAMLDAICFIYNNLNKLGKYELFKTALEIKGDVFKRFKKQEGENAQKDNP